MVVAANAGSDGCICTAKNKHLRVIPNDTGMVKPSHVISIHTLLAVGIINPDPLKTWNTKSPNIFFNLSSVYGNLERRIVRGAGDNRTKIVPHAR